MITEFPLVFNGDVITFQSNEYYVKKVNRVNMVVQSLNNGTTYNLPLRARFTKVDRPLTDAEKETLGLNITYKAKAMDRADRFAGLESGTVVVVTRPVNNKKWTYHPEQLFVVMKHNYDLVNIVRLGGDGGQYWRMTPESLEIQKEYS